MSFNGSSSLVQVASSPSLGLSSAMTLSAWIYPAASQSGWRTIMQREADAYFLNASNDRGRCGRPGAAPLGGGTNMVGGPTASPVGSWTHVAMTYDGCCWAVCEWGAGCVEGCCRGRFRRRSNPLRIGGNQPYGEYFKGLIDEVRGLQPGAEPAEIQTDMATPLGGASSDTMPPSAPGNVSRARRARQVDVSWSASTDNVGVTGYRVERCQGAGCTTFAQMGTPTGMIVQRYRVERRRRVTAIGCGRWMRRAT